MPDEKTAKPKRERPAPKVIPPISQLVAFAGNGGITIYRDPTAPGASGPTVITFYSPDQTRYQERTVNLTGDADADADTLAGQSRSFINKLAAGLIQPPPPPPPGDEDEEDDTPAASPFAR